MDARALGFARSFRTVVCPYSLITYMTSPADAVRLLAEARRVLLDDGVFVVDAFIPVAGIGDGEWRLDYRRPFEAGVLERSKRVTTIAPGVNRIERAYRVLSGTGHVIEEIRTEETLRPLTPDALTDLVSRNGFTIASCSWDYGRTADAAGARFFALTARAAG